MHLRILLSEITQRRYRFSKNENNIETLCNLTFFILQCLSKTTLFSRTVKIKILASRFSRFAILAILVKFLVLVEPLNKFQLSNVTS